MRSVFVDRATGHVIATSLVMGAFMAATLAVAPMGTFTTDPEIHPEGDKIGIQNGIFRAQQFLTTLKNVPFQAPKP